MCICCFSIIQPPSHTHTNAQIEIDSGSEVSKDNLMDELHPQQTAYRPKFDRPRPPANRRKGGRQNARNEEAEN